MSDRTWAYGLTADEWFHIASEGEASELPPCCGNIGEIRDLVRDLMTFQAADERGWRIALGRHLLASVEADGEGHGLDDAAGSFPLFARVLAGVRAEIAEGIV